jgi:hypothetical protein
MITRAIGRTARRDHALQRPRHHLLDGDEPNGDRRQQPILDLAREAEVLYQRERHRLNRRQRERHGDDPRQECRGVTRPHEAHAWQQVAEDDEEEDRLHDRPHQERRQLATCNLRIAPSNATKTDRADTGGRSLRTAVRAVNRVSFRSWR